LRFSFIYRQKNLVTNTTFLLAYEKIGIEKQFILFDFSIVLFYLCYQK
jgi:hypothetical protein